MLFREHPWIVSSVPAHYPSPQTSTYCYLFICLFLQKIFTKLMKVIISIFSLSFATSCDVSSDGEKISCNCIDGYFGARCHSCRPGYFGKPEVQGEYCKPCQCSGNINPDEPGSCDTVTGECLRCLNNTYGVACALCAPGYFGDAVNLKDCQGTRFSFDRYTLTEHLIHSSVCL